MAPGNQLFDRGARREIGQQAFRRGAVGREIPDPPKAEIGWIEAALWSPRRWKVHSCAAMSGASRTATAQAPGGFMIKAPWPDISHLLLAALSQAKALGGKNGTAFLNHSRTPFTASDLTTMLPSSSTSEAP